MGNDLERWRMRGWECKTIYTNRDTSGRCELVRRWQLVELWFFHKQILQRRHTVLRSDKVCQCHFTTKSKAIWDHIVSHRIYCEISAESKMVTFRVMEKNRGIGYLNRFQFGFSVCYIIWIEISLLFGNSLSRNIHPAPWNPDSWEAGNLVIVLSWPLCTFCL